MKEEKKKAGKQIKNGDRNLCTLGRKMGQTETEEVNNGPVKNQAKPKQRRWKHQARKGKVKQFTKMGPSPE